MGRWEIKIYNINNQTWETFTIKNGNFSERVEKFKDPNHKTHSQFSPWGDVRFRIFQLKKLKAHKTAAEAAANDDDRLKWKLSQCISPSFSLLNVEFLNMKELFFSFHFPSVCRRTWNCFPPNAIKLKRNASETLILSFPQFVWKKISKANKFEFKHRMHLNTCFVIRKKEGLKIKKRKKTTKLQHVDVCVNEWKEGERIEGEGKIFILCEETSYWGLPIKLEQILHTNFQD